VFTLVAFQAWDGGGGDGNKMSLTSWHTAWRKQSNRHHPTRGGLLSLAAMALIVRMANRRG
jgi:hypothetical protein